MEILLFIKNNFSIIKFQTGEISTSAFKVRKVSFEKSMKIKPHHIMKDTVIKDLPNSQNGIEYY